MNKDKKIPIAEISIIIPCLNEEKHLPALLESLQKQTLQPQEIIISDSRSSDKTREIAKQYRCIVADDYPKEGPGEGRNSGAKIATAPLLLFLDADVVLPPSFLEQAVSEFSKRDLAIASCKAIAHSNNSFERMGTQLWNLYLMAVSLFSIHACGYCIFVKKDIHEKIKGFDKTLFLAEDHEYARRASKFGKFGFLKPALFVSTRRFHEEGTLKTLLKYAIAELHLLFLGPTRKPLFRFEFGKHFKE